MSLDGPFIQASGYTRNRHLDQAPSVKWLGVHSAEGATDEVSLGNFFSRTRSGSSNCGIGQDGGYAQFVNYADTAWANPPLNEESDSVELCGFARWTREEWLACPAMLATLAQWIAWRCAVRGIPVVLLSTADLEARNSGIVDHRTINNVYHVSSHWDVGYNFPWDVVMAAAQGTAAVPVQDVPVPVTQDWAVFYNVGFSRAYITSIQQKMTQVGYPLSADGIRGPATQAAVKVFQQAQGLTVDGIPGAQTNARLDALLVSPAAPSVLDVDGGFGERTIRALQRACGVTDDGLFGPDSKRALQRKLGVFADGIFGRISTMALQRRVGVRDDGVWGPLTTMGIQRALNAGTF